ncbi:hypothetical protein [Nocardiopsis salina]|uniref:hypothetical protein n=1 Tax=Nocardiopsis salina TaxID=245836 RepID=UPI000349FE38|nr:hypothetical protein [Nocardiopsis salina]
MPNTGRLHWDYRDGRAAALAAAIAYSFWVLEIALPGGAAAQGALAAPGSTLEAVLESAHRTAAILVLVAAVLGLTLGAHGHGRALTVSWVAMAVFGLASLATTLFTGPCVVSTDVSCVSEALAEGMAGASLTQALVAVVAVLAALVAVVALAVDRWISGDHARGFVVAVAVLQVAAAKIVLVAASVVFTASGDGTPGVALGVLERAHLVTVALWLVTAGVLPGPWKRTAGHTHTAAR